MKPRSCSYQTNLTLSRLAGPDPAHADRFVPDHNRTQNPFGRTIVKKRIRTLKEVAVAMHSHYAFSMAIGATGAKHIPSRAVPGMVTTA